MPASLWFVHDTGCTPDHTESNPASFSATPYPRSGTPMPRLLAVQNSNVPPFLIFLLHQCIHLDRAVNRFLLRRTVLPPQFHELPKDRPVRAPFDPLGLLVRAPLQ